MLMELKDPAGLPFANSKGSGRMKTRMTRKKNILFNVGFFMCFVLSVLERCKDRPSFVSDLLKQGY